MLLSVRMLSDVTDVNHFKYTQSAEFTQGDGPDLYFQLVDISVDKHNIPQGRRYIPASGAYLQATFKSVDGTVTVTRNCTQPFADDLSIWKFQFVPGTDNLPRLVGSYALKVVLTEGAKTTTGFLGQAVSISASTPEF